MLQKLILPVLLLFNLSTSTWSQEITVMSYNIYHGENPYQPGTSNLPGIAQIIRDHSPGFVAMQEVDSMTERSAAFNDGRRINLVEELATLTGMKGLFGKAIDYSHGGYGEGLLIKSPDKVKSRYHLMLPIPGGGEDRAVLMVKSELANGTEIIFAGTHLCHQFQENRVAQAKKIVSYFKQSKEPVILCGDFNFKPGSEPYQIVTQYFDDAALMYGNPQFTIPAKAPRARIDYIFLSKNHNWQVDSLMVLKEDASDHMPVWSKIRLVD